MGSYEGGIPDIDVTISIIDNENLAVQGITVNIVDTEGNKSYGYPIDNYIDDSSLVTNELGEVNLLHVASFPEYSCGGSFYLLPPKCGTPEFFIVFLYKDKVYERVPLAPFIEVGGTIYVQYQFNYLTR
ncbi:TPA: hypothetical protein P0E05_001436 [Vibrio fluvialis]|nr:hypothetical protein [Vibrio fluvialis]